jgi:DNA topoisomerase-1
VQLAGEAIAATRKVIAAQFGESFVPSSPRVYKSKQKNAQEAHEAIRPTNPALLPDKVRGKLSQDQFRLYELIWKRTLACQMESAVLDRTTYTIATADGRSQFSATGSVVVFQGFLALYFESKDDDEDALSARLPDIAKGASLSVQQLDAEQHFTQAPPRYSEASLVKRMEELGIGRPSTYASILQVLKDREYVRLDKKRFYPEPRGRIVTAFLTAFFGRYVEYDFTADLEEQLDSISAGSVAYKDVLRQFWVAFSKAVEDAAPLTITDVIDRLNAELNALLFPKREDGSDPRACPSCHDGRLSLKLGKFGAFVGCSEYPTCNYTRQLSASELPIAQGDDDTPRPADGSLGEHPEFGGAIYLKKGPYGL